MTDKWWLNLVPGQKVYLQMERPKERGLAEVYSNGKKYIHISLRGTTYKVRKSDGCVTDYPYSPIYRSEVDHMDQVMRRAMLRDCGSVIDALLRKTGTSLTLEGVQGVEDAIKKLIGDSDD